jgi:DNA-binding LacI/PurR family transcriptional regulator
LRLSDVIERNQGIRLFSLATGSNAARNVASYLLELGHTNIAYISYLHRSDWSKARLCGLQEIYNRYGNGARVYPCTMDKYGFFNEFCDQVKDAEYYFPSITSQMSDSQMPSTVIRVLNSIKDKFTSQMVNEVIKTYMEILFKKAASISNVTAWVCANDFMATMAIDFIKRNMDKKIALVGFDDTFLAFRNGLTSYNFNIQSLVQLMLAHILNPSVDVPAKRLIPFEIEGLLVVRNTTFKKV